MKFLSKHNMAGIILTALLLFMLPGLMACSDGDDNDGGSSVVSDKKSDGDGKNNGDGKNEDKPTESPEERETEPEKESETEPAKELTLADGEAKLIYHDGSFISIAFHGPWRSIGATFAETNGESLGTFVGYGHPSDGWTIIQSEEFPERYALDEVLLSVSDHMAERNADGTYQRELYPITETLTVEEARAIGLDIIAGHICMVSFGKPSYGWDNFTAPFLYLNFLDEYCQLSSIDEAEGLLDSFSYYAEDGTPLEECFEGYTMEVSPGVSCSIKFYFYKDETSGRPGSELKEENKAKCDELRALKPYALYTAEDGTTQKFPFFEE